MSELLSVPLKKPSEVDIVKPLLNLIAATYSTADKPENFTDEINELSKWRNAVIWRAGEKNDNTLQILYAYYDQIHSLELKIPSSEVQIPFKWKDAFVKSGIFNIMKTSLTLSSLSYESVCVLFNIAALQSAIGANQSLDNDDGLKNSAKYFQEAAGIFDHLKSTVISALQVEPTPDLHPDTLNALSNLMLAQAQEIFFYKSVKDNMKDHIIARLASQCEDFYSEVLKLIQKEVPRSIIDREWILMISAKQTLFSGLAEYYQSLAVKANDQYGEQIARLQKSIDLLKQSQDKAGKPLYQDYIIKAEKMLKEANRDNEFIYHNIIPAAALLQAIPKVKMAKLIQKQKPFSVNFKDLFQSLIPLPVHQAMATYEVRKSELVNREMNELRKSTELLNQILASLNLPAALEETSGEAVPQSILEKSVATCEKGGIEHIEKMMIELPELLKRNNEILNETEKMLTEEQSSDEKLKDQFKEKWTRVPSSKLNELLKSNISKYRSIISTAMEADKSVQDKYNEHKNGMTLLSQGVECVKASIPCAANVEFKETRASNKLRQLMERVQTLKAERDTIEYELKSASTDMKDIFLQALTKESTINESVMSTETLGRVYGPLQQQVKDSVNQQETLLNEIMQINKEFEQERSGPGGVSEKREAIFKELAAAYNSFIELEKLLQEGTSFYNDLTELLVAHQNKITDFCFARKTEKDELLKDLTQGAGRAVSAPSPKLPEHIIAAAKNTSVTTPASSAPPSSASALPYPTQPQSMPMPFATPPTAPYPCYTAPLPTGYNPYATLPHYGTQPQTNQQQPYQYYGTYPPPHNQTYPQQMYYTQMPPNYQQPQQQQQQQQHQQQQHQQQQWR